MSKEQALLFNKGEWWQEHWKQMPEFEQKDLMQYKTIYVHFEKREDMDAFSALVGQRIGLNTKSIWYPEADIQHWSKKWVDEAPELENELEGDIEVLE